MNEEDRKTVSKAAKKSLRNISLKKYSKVF
jgi:hypothetical protein